VEEEVFDFTTAYPDFDIAAISAAKSKNVKMITKPQVRLNYERHLDRAFELMNPVRLPCRENRLCRQNYSSR
jgi:hypothetical protein